jgi:hypothetical protein
MCRGKIMCFLSKKRAFLLDILMIEVAPINILPSSENEKKELIKILEKAETDGEINLSQFCVPMGA